MTRQPIRSSLLFVAGMVLAGCLAGIALHNLVDAGPFKWHFEHPRFRQGLLEILALTLTSAVATRYCRLYGLLLSIAAVAFYARRQNIDYAFALVLVYSAGIITMGELAARSLRLWPRGAGVSLSRAVDSLVLGITFFGLGQWLLALTGIGFIGTIIAGWILALGALAGWLAIAYLHRDQARPHRSLMQGATALRTDLFIALAFYFLVFLGLSAIAKTNYAVDSDSLWYGLRPDRVLFHGGGLFSPVNLSPQVYYYPKLYELLTTPLSSTGDNSTVLAFGVACWAAYVAASAALASMVTSDRRMIFAFALMAGSTPAMIGIAPTAKGDLLAAALTVAGLCKLVEFNRTRQLRFAAVAAASLIVAPLVRMSALPYVAVAACCLMASYSVSLWQGRLKVNPLRQEDRRFWLVVVAAVAVFLIVNLRTYLLTGLPFIAPGALQHLFEGMGFNMRFPVADSLDWSRVPIPPLPGVVTDFLFYPAALPHVMFGWTGNAWLLLAIFTAIALLAKAWRPKLTRDDYYSGALLFAVGGLFFLILGSQHFGIRGGDGNYFIVPITALMAGGLLLCRRLPAAMITGSSLGSALVSAAIFMMANGLWWTGTTELNWNLSRNPLDNQAFQRQKFLNGGMQEVYEATGKCGADIAVVGALARPFAYLQPYRYEALTEIAWTTAYVESPRALADYLQKTGVDLLLLPKEEADKRLLSPKFIGSPVLYKHALQAAALLDATPLDISHYRVWALSDEGLACLGPKQPAAEPVLPARIVANGGNEMAKIWSESKGGCTKDASIVIHWTFTDASIARVRIHVVDESGKEVLFAAGGKSGMSTGKWIRGGNKFVMRNIAGDRILATHTVEVAPCLGRTEPP